MGRIDVMSAGNAEDSHCHGHVECSRYTFAGYVAYDETEFIVIEVIVIKVTAHLLGWQQRGVNVDVGAVGQRLMCLWHHAVLDTVGNAQFVLDAFVVGCCYGEFGNVLAERLLHVNKRLAQLPHFIFHFQFRNFHVKIAPCYFAGRFCQFFQRSGDMPDSDDAQKEYQQNSYQEGYSIQPYYRHERGEDVKARTD